MKILPRIFRFFVREAYSIPTVLRCALCAVFFPKRTLILLFMGTGRGGNWGDELNFHFFRAVTDKKIIVYPNTYFARICAVKNIVSIGSILCNIPNRNSIVWGSGIGNDIFDKQLRTRPKEILAVRGPLTASWLRKRGISCPDIYGDPALLLPLFYSPKRKAQKKIGVIPHLIDWNISLELINTLNADDVRIISMKHYSNWTDVIDEIVSCDVICSASLHGLIVAEAYGVPSVWIKFSEMKPGWDFKYHDFYASIGRTVDSATIVKNRSDLIDIFDTLKTTWEQAQFDTRPLLKAAPIQLSPRCDNPTF